MDNNTVVVTVDFNATNSSNTVDNNGFTGLIILKWLALLQLVGILVLNSIVIVLLFRRRKKSRMGFFVLNLAISDMCVGLFYALPDTVFVKFHAQWTEGFCKAFYIYFSMMAVYVSTYAIVVITIDRLYVIQRPLSTASRTTWYRYGLALSAWIIGGLLSIQYTIHGTFDPDPVAPFCYHDFSGPKYPTYIHMLWFDCVVLLVIPLSVIVICYGIIIKKIHDREKGGFIKSPDSYGQRHAFNPGQKNITKAKVKTIKLLLLVVIAYVIAWAPPTINAFLAHYKVITLGLLANVLYTLSPLNSLVNPLVFLLFNRKMFRQKTKRSNTTMATMKTKIDTSTSEQVVLIPSTN